MEPAAAHVILNKLSGLRNELVDLAFVLDVRGSCEAADVAITTSARLAELCAELITAAHTSPEDPAAI